MSYTVILQASTELPEFVRREAESRYRRALERSLGDPGKVVLTWQAWQHAEHTCDALTEDEWQHARRWIIAADRARAAAFADRDEPFGAYFEVQAAP